MTTIRALAAAIFAASIALSGTVQAQSAPAVAKPMAGDAMSQDCCAKPVRKHDHGAEKGTPTPTATAAPSTAAAAASEPAAAASSAKKPGHNHSTFHKTM